VVTSASVSAVDDVEAAPGAVPGHIDIVWWSEGGQTGDCANPGGPAIHNAAIRASGSFILVMLIFPSWGPTQRSSQLNRSIRNPHPNAKGRWN